MDGATPHSFPLPHLSGEAAAIAYYALPPEGAGDRSMMLLVVHGLGCQARSFDQPQLQQLRRLGTVVIPDLLGNGGSSSPRGEEHYTMRAQANCIVLLLQHLCQQRAGAEVCLIGHSMGGPIVLAVAEALLAAQPASLRLRCILYSEPNVDGGDCIGSRPGSRPGVDVSSLNATRAAKVATCRHLVAESDGGELLARMDAVRKQGLASLVLIGGRNKGQLTSERALLDIQFPCQWIADSGHSQHIDNPEKFYAAVGEFVTQVCARSDRGNELQCRSDSNLVPLKNAMPSEPEPEPEPEPRCTPTTKPSDAKQKRNFEWFSSRLRAATNDAQVIDFNRDVRAAISLELNKASAGRDAATRGTGAVTYSVEAQRWIASTEYLALRQETIRSFPAATYPFREEFANLLKLPEGVPLRQLHTLFHADQGSKGDRREKTAMLAPLRDACTRRKFEELYETLILRELAPMVARAMGPQCDTVVFQSFPCLRVLRPGEFSIGPHCDAQYNLPDGNVNVWLPLTDAFDTNSLYLETKPGKEDFRPLNLSYGEYATFYGQQCVHFAVENLTADTRVSLDFRVVPGCCYDESAASELAMGDQPALGSYYSSCQRDVGGEFKVIVRGLAGFRHGFPHTNR